MVYRIFTYIDPIKITPKSIGKYTKSPGSYWDGILAEMIEIWDEKGPHGFREDFRFSISWRGFFFNYNDGHVGKLQRIKQDAEKMPRKKKDLISLLDLFLVPLNQFLAGWSGWSANLTQIHQ